MSSSPRLPPETSADTHRRDYRRAENKATSTAKRRREWWRADAPFLLSRQNFQKSLDVRRGTARGQSVISLLFPFSFFFSFFAFLSFFPARHLIFWGRTDGRTDRRMGRASGQRCIPLTAKSQRIMIAATRGRARAAFWEQTVRARAFCSFFLSFFSPSVPFDGPSLIWPVRGFVK